MGWNHQLVRNNQKYTPQCLGQFASPCIPFGRLLSTWYFLLAETGNLQLLIAVLISNPWFQANAQGAKARFQGWKNPTERRVALRGHFWARFQPFFGLSWRWRKVFKNKTPDHKKNTCWLKILGAMYLCKYMYVHMFLVVNDIGIRMTPVVFPPMRLSSCWPNNQRKVANRQVQCGYGPLGRWCHATFGLQTRGTARHVWSKGRRRWKTCEAKNWIVKMVSYVVLSCDLNVYSTWYVFDTVLKFLFMLA